MATITSYLDMPRGDSWISTIADYPTKSMNNVLKIVYLGRDNLKNVGIELSPEANRIADGAKMFKLGHALPGCIKDVYLIANATIKVLVGGVYNVLGNFGALLKLAVGKFHHFKDSSEFVQKHVMKLPEQLLTVLKYGSPICLTVAQGIETIEAYAAYKAEDPEMVKNHHIFTLARTITYVILGVISMLSTFALIQVPTYVFTVLATTALIATIITDLHDRTSGYAKLQEMIKSAKAWKSYKKDVNGSKLSAKIEKVTTVAVEAGHKVKVEETTEAV